MKTKKLRSSITSEIHNVEQKRNSDKLNTDDDALKRRRRRLCVRHTIYDIYQGQWRQYAGKCAWVFVICRV